MLYISNNNIIPIISVLRKNLLLILLSIFSLIFIIIHRQPLRMIPSFVDWDTIITLSGLLLITTGIKESGFFYLLAYRISRQIINERILALFLIFVSVILAMFLTNDIALFIVIPLTICLQQMTNRNYSRIIIFEAIAVNVGSSLTAIGNPQNIFLWHRWNISFIDFTKEMSPLFLIMSVILFFITIIFFSPVKIEFTNNHHPSVNRKLFYISSSLLIIFIISIELQIEEYFLLIILLSLSLFRKRVILKTDWGLILLFIVIFIDLNLIYQIKSIQHFLTLLNFNNSHTLFFTSAFTPQIISNVPSAILLADYSSNFKIIAYGINIGGNGLIIGSFANLIALRFINNRFKFWLFHTYSVPYFIITFALTYYLLIK